MLFFVSNRNSSNYAGEPRFSETRFRCMGVVQISISQNNPMRHPMFQNKTACVDDD